MAEKSPGRAPIVFIVPGAAPAPGAATRGTAASAADATRSAALPQGRIKQSVRIAQTRGAPSTETRVEAVPGEDVVVLHLQDGPSLVLHPENARDLFLAQTDRKRSDPGVATEDVTVPATLAWRSVEAAAPTRARTRGFLGDVLLKAVDIVTGLFENKAADVVAAHIVEQVDAQVRPGVYRLSQAGLPSLRDSGADPVEVVAPGTPDAPVLVFLHGTFSNTSGTFGKLWAHHPDKVRRLFEHYGANNVYALDHPTLGQGPIENALMLAEALPKNARVHLVTHSRGGLVGEVLARVCADPNIDPDAYAAAEADGKTDKHSEQREALRQLVKRVRERSIRVDRMVRVACPARGTLLASKRLDAYVSVLEWALKLAQIPVLPALVDFLGAVAKHRTDSETIPGLEAMMPESPLVQWLHTAAEPLPSDLRVVAGDMEGDSVASWLKTLLSDAFFWTDNDLVVQTRSMYGGAPRDDGATFLLDQRGDVSHFRYFTNDLTAEAIVSALVRSDVPAGFREIGPLSWQGKSSTGTRAARRTPIHDVAPSELPAVIVLPGILGSHLAVGDKRIWLSLRLAGGFERLQYREDASDGVRPDGPIGMFYDDLIDHLAATHEVIPFSFDWRRPIEEAAKHLAKAVTAALDARSKSGKPVRLLAHSMGGLVARTLQLEAEDVWKQMLARDGARILMLGTPNAGSWVPMQVLSGDDTFGNLITLVGAPFRSAKARQWMAAMPGFLQLQASLADPELKLGSPETWKALARKDRAAELDHAWWHREREKAAADRTEAQEHGWGIPSADVLKQAVALRERLDGQVGQVLADPAVRGKVLLVVGQDDFTPDGYKLTDDGLVYLDAPQDGDGRVTLDSACLPGVRTWQADSTHGDLPATESAFDAYVDLLVAGDTKRLPRLGGGTRGGSTDARVIPHTRTRASRDGVSDASPPGRAHDLFAPRRRAEAAARRPRGTALSVAVVNGDVRFVRQPLLIGHYSASTLTGAERIVDSLIGGAMAASLEAGLYPERPRSHQVFLNSHTDPENPWRIPRPAAVVVVGLGDEGELRGSDLVATVRQGVIAYAQRQSEATDDATFEMAATLIGSGGSGITVGQAAQAIVQGVREANERLREVRWPTVGALVLIELYLDRASEALRALNVQATAAPNAYRIAPTIQPGQSALRAVPDFGYRGADYDFISALRQPGSAGLGGIVYTLDTKRARSEVRAQATQDNLIRALAAAASNDAQRDPLIGRTLFQLLVPPELEPFLAGSTETVMEVDEHTARIPWELLDAPEARRSGGDPRPWAVRAKLLRKLRTKQFRTQVSDASPEAHILVIGEPACDDKYPPLPGARQEALAIGECLTRVPELPADRVRVYADRDEARVLVNALFECDWHIVHIAGHGEPPLYCEKKDKKEKELIEPGGVVLSSGVFLGPREIRNMRIVPHLVFVNCCHLAAGAQTKPYDRGEFAATVAEELIAMGVRCVIAAGWAVEDGPAKAFATTFYGALLRGTRFIDAVALARDEARQAGGNTWAAYQCYGDPEWTLRFSGQDAQRPPRPVGEEFAAVASPMALVQALETLAVRANSPHADTARIVDAIRNLSARFAGQWGGIGAVAEAFAVVCAAVRNIPEAIRWYERALGAADGSASMRTAEQLANLRVRAAWEAVKDKDKLTDDERDRALAEIDAALATLTQLSALHPTMEREALRGSAYKRQALLYRKLGNSTAAQKAVVEMARYFATAEQIGRQAGLRDWFYPALNRIAATLVTQGRLRKKRVSLEEQGLDALRQRLADQSKEDPDFWSLVGQTELRMYEALARDDLASHLPTLLSEYDDLHRRVATQWLWASVLDTAEFVLRPRLGSRNSNRPSTRAARELVARLSGFAHGSGAAPKPRRRKK